MSLLIFLIFTNRNLCKWLSWHRSIIYRHPPNLECMEDWTRSQGALCPRQSFMGERACAWNSVCSLYCTDLESSPSHLSPWMLGFPNTTPYPASQTILIFCLRVRVLARILESDTLAINSWASPMSSNCVHEEKNTKNPKERLCVCMCV